MFLSQFEDSARSLVVPVRGFEQFDWIAKRVLEQHLSDGNSAGLVIAKVDAGAAEALDGRVKVGDLNQDAIPSTRRGKRAIRQRVPTRMGAGHAQQQPQVVSIQHREHRAVSSLLLEAEMLRVKVDR